MTAGRWQIRTALAGAILFAGGAVAVGQETLLPGDGAAFDFVRDMRAGWVTHAAKALTWLGSAPVTWSAVVVAAVVLAVRDRPVEAATLVIGMAVTAVVMHLTKAAVDRPRPAHPLVGTQEQSYPSGHASYAAAYVAIAMTARRRWLVVAAVFVAVVVGLTRVYLRAHYLSDVLGGFGLAAAAFSLVGLLVSQVRHNVGEAT